MRKVWITALCLVLVSSILVTAAGPKGGPNKVQQEGEITAIDSALKQITVGDVTVQVTETTLITMKRVPMTFDDLAVGMTVKVCGKMADEVLIAEKINVMYLGQ